jgi:serine/threonine-protein phosphatase 2A regulatory subunit B'
MELNAVSIDGEMPAELDETGIERVPMADPGFDVRIYNMHA